jgi:hypothetical protein
VTFPEVMNKLLQVSGVTGAASAGTAHTHPINYLNSFSTTGTSDVLQNTSVGGYITASNTTVFDTVAIQAQRGAGTALNNVFLEVLREDSLGGLTTVSSRDISASLTTTLSYLEFPLPAPIIVQSGEKYVVRLRNASTVATALGVIAIIEDVTSVRASFFTSTAALSSKTSYTAAEATAARNAGGLLPFALLAAKNIAEPDVSYSDDFNRANLGPWWFPSGAGTAVIAGEKLTYGGTTSGDEDALYIRRTSGDASLSSANIYVDAGATTQRLGLLHHANRDLTQFVYLSVTPTNARIYSFTGGTLTQRASVAGGGTGQYSIYYDEVADKYVALKDGNPIPGLQWTSVGSTIKHGPDYRFGGLRISRASSINAGTIDNWLMRDFRP